MTGKKFGRRHGAGRLGCRWWPSVYARWVFGLPLAAALLYLWAAVHFPAQLEMTVATDLQTTMRVDYDDGSKAGGGQLSAGYVLPVGSGLRKVHLPVKARQIEVLRFHPSQGPVVMRLGSMRIRSGVPGWFGHRTIYTFDLRRLRPLRQIAEFEPEGDTVRIVVRDDGGDACLTIAPPVPFRVGPDWTAPGGQVSLFTLGWLMLWIAGVEAGRRLARPWAMLAAWWRRWLTATAVWLVAAGVEANRRLARPRAMLAAWWGRRSTATAVWLVAAGSVMLSCYPVIFLGKSFVSPNFEESSYRLYARFPTLPGNTDTVLEHGRGSDIDAMGLAHFPYAAIESRALFRDHELPLWNRYNYCGLPLLGQGQSMFGDPLHLLVIAAGGRAWAWDAKFVLAKWLFAAGVGLLVFAATDCRPAALLLSFSSAFIGFFTYRLNHPAYFSLCYAPWILYTWLRIVRAATWREAMRWALGLVLANWTELNSGTAKEAYMLLACLNGGGALALALSRQPLKTRGLRFAGVLGVGGIFCLLAAPVLLAFFSTLTQMISIYDSPHVWQLQPGMVVGLFDDIFYRQFKDGEEVVDPSANFLVLLGVLLALSALKRLVRNRIFLAVAVSALFPLAMAFGVMPPALIRRTPLLGNILRVDNTFSCVLLIYLFVLAGFGLKHCMVRANRAAWRLDVVVAFLIGGALLGLFFGFTQAATQVSHSFLALDREIERSPFFYGYVFSITAALLCVPLLLRRLAVRGPDTAAAVLLAVCLLAIHWRMGLQVHTPFSKYTAVLPNRVDMQANSRAIDFLHGDHEDAFRTVGLNGCFGQGYGGTVDLEGIHGPDALFNLFLFTLERVSMQDNIKWVSTPIDRERLVMEKRFHDLMNVRYYLTMPGEAPGDDVAGLCKVAALDLDVYRNDHAWPRAFFVDQLELYDGEKQFATQVLAGDGRPFASMQIGETLVPVAFDGHFARLQEDRTVVAATNFRLTNHRTSFDLQAPGPGIVVLTEAYMKRDLVATLNGREVPIFRVNHAFRGVIVDRPGFYRVTYEYLPRHFTAALWASGLGLVLLAASGWRLYRGRRGGTVPPVPEQPGFAGRPPAREPVQTDAG